MMNKTNMDQQKFNLEELCKLTDFSVRTVRYYMQLGLVDRPVGETRAAHYTQKHLDQLILIKRLTDSGISLERVGEVMAGGEPPISTARKQPGSIEVKSHLFIAPGIELQISAEEVGMSPEQLRSMIKEIMVITKKVLLNNGGVS
jgi:DNA-binding transcriptional MerR regulator